MRAIAAPTECEELAQPGAVAFPGRRQRTIGRTAQRCNANGYQLAQNLTAALAWHLRTGGDLSCIWRNGIPPGILPDPVGLAA